MNVQNNYIQLLLLASLFLVAPYLCAQEDTDSILRAADKLTYENPDKAIEIATVLYENPATSDKYKINALMTISNAYSSKRDYEKSLEYVFKIRSYLPKIKDKKQQINILNKVGSQYNDLKIYDKSIDYLDEAFDLLEAYPQKDSTLQLLGYNYILRGFVYREQMGCDVALKYFDKAIETYNKTLHNPIMNANVSICYYNKGNCLFTLDRVEEAEQSFQKSIVHAEQINAQSLIAFAQKGLAEVKSRRGNYREAIDVLNSAITNSEKVGDLVLNRGLYEGLSNNYLALNDWENYTLYREKFLKLQNETRISERKSINQSLLNITIASASEIERSHALFKPLQIGLIILIVLFLFLLIRLVLTSEKKLNRLKKELKE